MFRFLENNNPVLYFFLLVFIILLHIPLFHEHYYGIDESIYILCAKKIANGGVMYVDAWDNKPPILFWFYILFVRLFGDYTFFGLRVFSIIYYFIAAVIFNQLFYFYRFSKSFHIWPGILLVLLCLNPWYATELNAEHLMLLPTLFMLLYACFYFIEGEKKWSYLYWIGILGALCMGFKYQGILNLVGILMGIFLFYTLKPQEILTIFLGFMTVILIVFLNLYFTDSLNEFIDIGFLYNFDYMRVGKNLGEEVSFYSGLKEYLKNYGVVMILGILGILNYRAKFYTMAIRQRKIETLLLSLTITSSVAILLGGSRLYLHYFIQILPFLLIHAVYFALSRKKWGIFLLWANFIFPLFTISIYYFVSTPERFQWIQPYIKNDGWVHSKFEELNLSKQEKLLLDDLNKNHSVVKDIFIADFLPDLYLKLNKSCALKYVNFSLTFYKMNWLSQHKGKLLLWSKPEQLSDLYKELLQKKPQYIIDSQNIFLEWKDKIPLFLNQYKMKKVGNYNIYYL